jgi:hypothetical protein
MKPPITHERELQRRIRRFAEMGLRPHQVFALLAPEYDPYAIFGGRAVRDGGQG